MDRKDLDKDHAGKNPVIHHDDNPGVGDHIGEAAGGISGVLAGAAIGSVGGPIGTIIGGIAGAVGGWWSGRAVSEAATRLTQDDDKYYRGHYEGSSTRLADRSYDDVRPAYHLGHIAANNPDYKERDFDAVEADLRRGWNDDMRSKHGEWDSMRGYARHGFEYGRGRSGATNASASSFYGSAAGATAGGLADRAVAGADSLKDRVDGNPASKPGLDATDRTRTAGGVADRVENATENAWDRTKNAASNLGNKAANAADNLKDRVDGNPASKPGPDATDRR